MRFEAVPLIRAQADPGQAEKGPLGAVQPGGGATVCIGAVVIGPGT